MTAPVIEHWVVTVARAAGLEGVDDLHVGSDTPTAEAWNLVSMVAGLNEDELAERVASHFRLPIADLNHRDPHAEKIIPAAVARRLEILPLRYTDRSLIFGSADPVGLEAERELTSLAGRTIHPEVASPGAIRTALTQVYPQGDGERHEIPRLTTDVATAAHVLVVDDDADTRALLRNALQARGFLVTEASDGTEAIQLLASPARFDLLTLDLNMPQMDGLEALERIRRSLKTANLPVIVATGSTNPKVEMALFEAGADDYVIKPIDPPRFVLRVQAVLRRRGSVPTAS